MVVGGNLIKSFLTLPAYRRSTSYSPHPALILVRIVSNLLACYTGLRSGAEQDFSTPSCPLYLVHGVYRIANSWLSGNPISMHFPLSLSLRSKAPLFGYRRYHLRSVAPYSASYAPHLILLSQLLNPLTHITQRRHRQHRHARFPPQPPLSCCLSHSHHLPFPISRSVKVLCVV